MSGKQTKNQRARAVAAQRVAQQRAAERRRRAIVASAVAVAVLAVVAFIGVAVYLTNRPAADVASPAGGNSRGVTIGAAKAPVTVDVYLDFQCPACKQFEQQSGPTLQKYVDGGTVKVVYHPVAYLDRFSSGTEYSTRSSAASACAADAGKLPEFVTAIYAVQPAENGTGLTNDRIVQVGRTAGATGDTFASCVRDQTYADWTAAVTDAASKGGVNGTPTIKVAGKTLDDPSADKLSAAIDAAR